MKKVHKGLEDIYVAETSICKIDGEEGKLWYRGFNINDLAEFSNYEEVCYLLLHGRLPDQEQLEEFTRELARTREVPKDVRQVMREVSGSSMMEMLRTTVSAMAEDEPPMTETDKEQNIETAKKLIAKLPTIAAYSYRMSKGKDLVKPKRSSLSHAANFYYMLHGEEPDEAEERAVDNDLLLHADHAFNASAFAARLSTSTMSDMYSSVVAAISTLSGPYHGGASEQAWRAVREVGEVDNVEDYIQEKIDNGERIMGFGHRVYEVTDPRAKILKKNAGELLTGPAGKWVEIQDEMERVMEEELDLYANVDFYSGSVYHALKIPTELYTPMFALGRISGWCAHIIEQAMDNRLIRPRGKFIGVTDKKYEPVEKRD